MNITQYEFEINTIFSTSWLIRKWLQNLMRMTRWHQQNMSLAKACNQIDSGISLMNKMYSCNLSTYILQGRFTGTMITQVPLRITQKLCVKSVVN